MFQNIAEITMLALVDAINPCTLAVQALLLSALLITKGRKEALLGGILFSITILIMYFLYGMGILQIIYASGMESVIRILLKSLLLIMIILELSAYFRYRPGFTSMEMPTRFRPITKKLLSSVEDARIAPVIAVMCSILLLPCSSGPYVAMLMIIRNMQIFQKILSLLYYNIIFILPMIGITLAIFFGTSPEKIMKLRNRYIRELHLIAGILLILVFLMT